MVWLRFCAHSDCAPCTMKFNFIAFTSKSADLINFTKSRNEFDPNKFKSTKCLFLYDPFPMSDRDNDISPMDVIEMYGCRKDCFYWEIAIAMLLMLKFGWTLYPFVSYANLSLSLSGNRHSDSDVAFAKWKRGTTVWCCYCINVTLEIFVITQHKWPCCQCYQQQI